MANENEGPNAPYATPSWRPVASRQCQSAPRIGAGSTGSVGTTVAGRTRRGNLFSPLSTTGFSAAPAPTWQSLAMGLQPTPPRASLTASASPLAAEPHVAIRRSDELRQQSDALIVDLRSMMEDTQTSDIVIVLDSGEELTAHRAILAARSDVFRTMLVSSGFRECSASSNGRVTVGAISRAAMRACLEWCYTGQVSGFLAGVRREAWAASACADLASAEPSRTNRTQTPPRRRQSVCSEPPAYSGVCAATEDDTFTSNPELSSHSNTATYTLEPGLNTLLELLAAAERFNLQGLKRLVQTEVQESYLTPANACHVLLTAHTQGADALRRVALDYVATHRKEVKESFGFDVLAHEPDLLLQLLLRV